MIVSNLKSQVIDNNCLIFGFLVFFSLQIQVDLDKDSSADVVVENNDIDNRDTTLLQNHLSDKDSNKEGNKKQSQDDKEEESMAFENVAFEMDKVDEEESKDVVEEEEKEEKEEEEDGGGDVAKEMLDGVCSDDSSLDELSTGL